MSERAVGPSQPVWQDGVPDPLWSRSVRPLSARFRRLGLAIEVQANSRWLLELARDAFGPPDMGTPSDERSPDLRLSLIEGPPPGGDGWPLESGREGSPLASRDDVSATAHPIFREHDGLFAAFDGAGSGGTADLHAGIAVAWVCAGAAADRVRSVVIESILWRLATRRGQLALHGAAIVVDGVAVIVRGAAGAGKSSVAMAADAAGAAVLAEEVVWIEPERWTIWPSALRIHFDDEAALQRALGIEAWPTSRTGPGSNSWMAGAKLAVPLTTTPPAAAVPIGPLVLLHPVTRSSAPIVVSWHVVGAAEARSRCESERIVGEHAQPADRWKTVVERLCDGGAYGLQDGDPAARAAALGEIVRHWRLSRASADLRLRVSSRRRPSSG